MMETRALKFKDRVPWVLDQTRIPQDEIWLETRTVDEMVSHIQSLRIRGAPLIATAAVMALLGLLENNPDVTYENFLGQLAILRRARPTAVNLMNDLDSLKSVVEEKNSDNFIESARSWIHNYLKNEILCYDKIGENGAKVFVSGDVVLTHCNTGALATYGRGTALSVIESAFRAGKIASVIVDETRPLLQGGRLTAWELEKLAIPYHIICDNMAGFLMAQGRVSKIVLGADRIARNGDFANKIGTYSLAVLAQFHKIPFYVAAPRSTVDLRCPSGREIPIEERAASEVLGATIRGNYHSWAPKEAKVYNPSFDVTPGSLVTAYIFEDGIKTASEIC